MRKTIILAAAAASCGLMPGVALADAREEVVTGLTRCANLTEDRQWLDCYYAAAQPMRAQLGLSPAPQAQLKLLYAQPKAQALPSSVARAAVNSGPPPMPKTAGMLAVWGGDDVVQNAPVKTFDDKPAGFVITLPDGQVWQQTPEDKARRPASWRMPAASMRVTITQGAMGTFNLKMNDENIFHKVKRVR